MNRMVGKTVRIAGNQCALRARSLTKGKFALVAAQETTLQDVLEGTKQYLVPLYQRPYQWGKDQLSQLWEDIVELTDDRRDGTRDTHFIGSLVLAPPPASVAGGVNTFLVVDGQQRLTTLTILLAAIRDYVSDLDSEDVAAEEIQNRFLVNQYKRGNRHIKLVPTQKDRDAFNGIIRRLPGSGGTDKIGEAYRYFRVQLEKFDDPDDPDDIQEILDAVTEGLALVSISTHPDDNVHRIFQSLNNTGLRLTQGDLLRNYIFMRLPDSGEEAYASYWKPLQDRLGNEKIEDLFWIDLAEDHPAAKVGDTFMFQQRRLGTLETEKEISQELLRLNNLAFLYQLILDPSMESAPVVRHRLERLQQWGTTTTHPIILRLLRSRADGNADNEEVARALLYIESYLVRRILFGMATQGLNRIFRSMVAAITDEEPVDIQVRRWLSSGRRHFVSDSELRSAIQTNPFYRSGRAEHRKIFLRWLEEEFASKEPIDTSMLTIEHVMPQTLNNKWRDYLVQSHPGEDIDELHEKFLHTLGNLTLTGYNSSLSNREFDWKRAEMAKSGLRLSASITRQETWGPDQISRRGDELADRIITSWPGPLHESDTTVAPMWRRLRQLLAALPAGRWTSYGDLARTIGTGAQPVGNYVRSNRLPNAYRILRNNGGLSPGFQWIDENDDRDPMELLHAEGITFNARGIADPTQRLTEFELQELLALADPEE